MSRVLKSYIPERGGTITLPVCSVIRAIGFQNERPRPAAPVTAPSAPSAPPVPNPRIDVISPASPGSERTKYRVVFTDVRDDDSNQIERIAEIDAAKDEHDVTAWYTARGYTVISVAAMDDAPADPVAAADDEKPARRQLVPVLWFEAPDTSLCSFDVEAWPKADIDVVLIPTGGNAPCGWTYLGSMQRPQRSNPERDAVFHVYIAPSSFVTVSLNN